MNRTRFLAGLMFVAMASLVGCGGGGGSSAPTGTVSVRFGSDSFPGYQQAVVSIEKIEWSPNGGSWYSLGTVQATFDLLAIQNGKSAPIVASQTVTAGTYNQFRITWATKNYQSQINQPAYVVPNGGAGQILTMPATTVVPGTVNITAGGTTQVLLMMNGAQAVVPSQNGTSTAYLFNATGNAYDLSTCGQISGTLGNGSPLAGQEVFAETLDGVGTATIQRRALTDAQGKYTFEGLPSGSVYYLAALPTNCLAGASGAVNVVKNNAYPMDLTVTSTSLAAGTLDLVINPPSSSVQGTWGELRQSLATGSSGSQTLIVRSQTATVGPQTDTVLFSVAPGTYGVTAQRSTSGATPVMNHGSQQILSSGNPSILNMTF